MAIHPYTCSVIHAWIFTWQRLAQEYSARGWRTYVYTETAASDSEGVVPFYHDPTKTNEARRREVLGDIQTVVPLSSRGRVVPVCHCIMSRRVQPVRLYVRVRMSLRMCMCVCVFVCVYREDHEIYSIITC